MARVGHHDHDRSMALRGSPDAVGLVVAVEGFEWHREPSLRFLPLRSLPNRAVGDVAQCAVASPEAGTDPIGKFAAKRAVGVVDPDEPDDAVGGSIAGSVIATASPIARRTRRAEGEDLDSMADGKTAAEPFASRWKRRVRTIPTMLAVTVFGLAASPLILVSAAAVDIAKRRFRMPTVRVALFLVQYAINDSIEIVLAPVYWMLAGFGTRLDQPGSRRRHEPTPAVVHRHHRFDALSGFLDCESTSTRNRCRRCTLDQ